MKNEVVITAADFQRLKDLIRTARCVWPYGAYVNALERELRRARIVPPDHVPEDAVTMNSRVRLRDRDIDERAIYTVVYPHHADEDEDKLSVLSPLATAILGNRVGDVVRCPVPSGTRTVKIERIFYQPEAAGDYHL
ncbi:MAG: nucleoside diphosphate kinase regulator [Bacillota bacterium]